MRYRFLIGALFITTLLGAASAEAKCPEVTGRLSRFLFGPPDQEILYGMDTAELRFQLANRLFKKRMGLYLTSASFALVGGWLNMNNIYLGINAEDLRLAIGTLGGMMGTLPGLAQTLHPFFTKPIVKVGTTLCLGLACGALGLVVPETAQHMALGVTAAASSFTIGAILERQLRRKLYEDPGLLMPKLPEP